MGPVYRLLLLKNPYVHGQLKRLGIPGVRYVDGPRGIILGQSTAFPCTTARGATWDTSLEERVGRAIGIEGRLRGANMVGSACINLPRHPAWGRVQETYGEDPYLLGEMGAAHVCGLQENVMACVKHDALNSMESARFRVDVKIDPEPLHEVFLPHFQQCVDAGALSIMTAYNAVNGEWAGEHLVLLRDILRKQWGFDGITITDWVYGLHDAVRSVEAGQDIEAPFRNRRDAVLESALAEGTIQIADIDRIGMRILSTQLKHYATRKDEEPSIDEILGKEHRDLARQVATRSITLLKNANVEGTPALPLRSDLSTCAIIGRHVDSPLTGDRASSLVDCPDIITPLSGIRNAFPGTEIHLSASDSVQEAVISSLQRSRKLLSS